MLSALVQLFIVGRTLYCSETDAVVRTILRVANAVPLAITRAVPATIGGRRIVAVPDGGRRPGSTGPGTFGPVGPRSPVPVDGCWSLAHRDATSHDAPLVDATLRPLGSRLHPRDASVVQVAPESLAYSLDALDP